MHWGWGMSRRAAQDHAIRMRFGIRRALGARRISFTRMRCGGGADGLLWTFSATLSTVETRGRDYADLRGPIPTLSLIVILEQPGMVWWGGCQTKPTLHPPPRGWHTGLGGSDPPPLEVVTRAWGVWTPPQNGCHSSLGGLRARATGTAPVVRSLSLQ